MLLLSNLVGVACGRVERVPGDIDTHMQYVREHSLRDFTSIICHDTSVVHMS